MIGGSSPFGISLRRAMKYTYFTGQAILCSLMLMSSGCQTLQHNSSSQALDSRGSNSNHRDERFVGSWKFTNETKFIPQTGIRTPEDVEKSERVSLRREIFADGNWHLAGIKARVSGTWKSVETPRGVWIEFRTTSRNGRRDERLLLSRDGKMIAGFLPDPSDGSLMGYRQVYTRVVKP